MIYIFAVYKVLCCIYTDECYTRLFTARIHAETSSLL